MAIRLRPAVFLDKDGTLIPDIPYNVDPERISLVPDAGEALRDLRDAGYVLCVVSNQSGAARGYFPEPRWRACANGCNRWWNGLVRNSRGATSVLTTPKGWCPGWR